MGFPDLHGVCTCSITRLCWALGTPQFAIVLLPAVMLIVLSSELRSGVALDSWWRASYRKGDWQYGALIVWHTIGLIVFLGMTCAFTTIMPAGPR